LNDLFSIISQVRSAVYRLSMSIHSRTSRSLTLTIVLLVVCVTDVLVGADDDDDDVWSLTAADGRQRREARGSHGQHELRQYVSDCSAVHRFVRQTMHYSNALPASKNHGTFSDEPSELACRTSTKLIAQFEI